jgi:hypothetical protein
MSYLQTLTRKPHTDRKKLSGDAKIEHRTFQAQDEVITAWLQLSVRNTWVHILPYKRYHFFSAHLTYHSVDHPRGGRNGVDNQQMIFVR